MGAVIARAVDEAHARMITPATISLGASTSPELRDALSMLGNVLTKVSEALPHGGGEGVARGGE